MLDDYAVNHPFAYADEERAELAPFLPIVYPADRPADQPWLEGQGPQGPMPTFTLPNRMNGEIAGRFLYQLREEQGVQPPALTLARGSGSCRDFAALFMEACRQLGLACRFVSGYLFTFDTDAGNASTHAWTEVYAPASLPTRSRCQKAKSDNDINSVRIAPGHYTVHSVAVSTPHLCLTRRYRFTHRDSGRVRTCAPTSARSPGAALPATGQRRKQRRAHKSRRQEFMSFRRDTRWIPIGLDAEFVLYPPRVHDGGSARAGGCRADRK